MDSSVSMIRDGDASRSVSWRSLAMTSPDRATIPLLAGRHKDTPIILRGEVSYGDPNAGARVHVQLDANAVRIDRELFDALPVSIQGVWRDLDPSGAARDQRAERQARRRGAVPRRPALDPQVEDARAGR